MTDPGTRRSGHWFEAPGTAGFIHRASMRADGLTDDSLRGRPVVGICNSFSDLVSCNLHFRGLAAAVKRGVLLAGGLPVEFPVLALGENLMKPTAMLYRNLAAMDVEESIRAYPFDAVVLLGGCDKSIPAQLMGAASAGVPAIMVTGGPSVPATRDGRALGNGTDLWHFLDDHRSGRMSAGELAKVEAAATPSVGHCTEMGTASTMSALCEALGMTLAGTSTVPAVLAGRIRAAEVTGTTAVRLAREGVTPADILTAAAFENAVTMLLALGGSTNAVLHLLALAGRVGVDLTLDTFDAISRRVPTLVDILPAGTGVFADLDAAGGIPAVIDALGDLYRSDVTTVTDHAPAAAAEHRAASVDAEGTIRPRSAALKAPGGLSVLRGNLAPRGAILKVAAASPALLRHTGPALVFDGIEDLLGRIDDPGLPVTPETVLVLRGAGPVGAPGMPEWGQIPIPAKLLRAGVHDMVRISDARMSGTAFGTVVLHVAPEAAVGGPLAAVRDGDLISLDVEARSLELLVDDDELARRPGDVGPLAPPPASGYIGLYRAHVQQADLGCDFDFLRGVRGQAREPFIPTGWGGGW